MADGSTPLVQGAFELAPSAAIAPPRPPEVRQLVGVPGAVVESTNTAPGAEATPSPTAAEQQQAEKAKQDKREANGFWGRLFHRKAQETRDPQASIQGIANDRVPMNPQMESQIRAELSESGKMTKDQIEVQIQRLRHEGVKATVPPIPKGPEASPVNQTDELIRIGEQRVREPNEEAIVKKGYSEGLSDALVEYIDHLTYDQLKAFKEQSDAFIHDTTNKNRPALAAERSKYAGYRLGVLEMNAARAQKAADEKQKSEAEAKKTAEAAELAEQAEREKTTHPDVDWSGAEAGADPAEGSVESAESTFDLDDARERLIGYDRLLRGVETRKKNVEIRWDSVEKQLIDSRLAKGESLDQIESDIKKRREMLNNQIQNEEEKQQAEQVPTPEPAVEAPTKESLTPEQVKAAIDARVQSHVKEVLGQWKSSPDHARPATGTPDYDKWCDDLADAVMKAEKDAEIPAAMQIWEEQNPNWEDDPAKIKERKQHRQQLMTPHKNEEEPPKPKRKKEQGQGDKPETTQDTTQPGGMTVEELQNALSDPETAKAVAGFTEALKAGAKPEATKKRKEAIATLQKKNPKLASILSSAAGITAIAALLFITTSSKG